MLFPTLDFALFFWVVFALSWALFRQPGARKALLLLASYFFYGYWDWRFMALLALSSAINYGVALLISSSYFEKGRKIYLSIGILANLAILCWFKYAGFFLESLSDLLFAVGLERDIPLFEIILPVGISFYTFQGISYLVDVYRREIEARPNPLDVFLYISFFPQLVAGPIVRAAHFLPQLDKTPSLNGATIGFGFAMILSGLFKKMVVANIIATRLTDEVFVSPAYATSLDLLIGVYGYAVQIYCDFSGYSDIAIGVAALLGFHFTANFDHPYRAASLREFWRRWHISLSTWLRDYVYKPLGGSRAGGLMTARNLFLTMFLGGVWHGAAWTFVLWGALHGSALVVERLFGRMVPNALSSSLALKIVGTITTFHLVCVGWIFFRSETLQIALDYFSGLMVWTSGLDVASPGLIVMIFAMLLAHFLPSLWWAKAGKNIGERSLVLTGAYFCVLLAVILMLAPEGTAPFIYFQF